MQEARVLAAQVALYDALEHLTIPTVDAHQNLGLRAVVQQGRWPLVY